MAVEKLLFLLTRVHGFLSQASPVFLMRIETEVTAQLVCTFVIKYAINRFSYDGVHMYVYLHFNCALLTAYLLFAIPLLLPFKKLIVVLMLNKAWRNSQSKAE